MLKVIFGFGVLLSLIGYKVITSPIIFEKVKGYFFEDAPMIIGTAFSIFLIAKYLRRGF